MMNSLHSAGSRQARQTAASASQDPPKYFASVKTESAAAPPASYVPATATGSTLGRIVPVDGEAPLISAITANPGDDSAWRNPLAGRGRSAAAATAADGRMAFLAATSARLCVPISSRIIVATLRRQRNDMRFHDTAAPGWGPRDSSFSVARP